jgi:hypothetical protein
MDPLHQLRLEANVRQAQLVGTLIQASVDPANAHVRLPGPETTRLLAQASHRSNPEDGYFAYVPVARA